jgi:hypothetical protein
MGTKVRCVPGRLERSGGDECGERKGEELGVLGDHDEQVRLETGLNRSYPLKGDTTICMLYVTEGIRAQLNSITIHLHRV